MNGPVSTAKAWVCIVDDDESVRKSLANLLRSAGLDPLPFSSGEAFLGSGMAREAGCVLLDLKMPGLGGLQVLRELAAMGWRVPVICMTAHWNDAGLDESMREGAVACLRKPFSEEALLQAIGLALAV